MDLIEAHAETLIVATHDLTLLSRFETIIVMINGKIVEKGNYQQLLANQGALWNMIQYMYKKLLDRLRNLSSSFLTNKLTRANCFSILNKF